MSNIIIPSDPKTKQTLLNAIKEISDSMTRVESERDLIKEIIDDVSDNVEVPKKYIRKMATIYHKQNLTEVKGEMDDVEALYESVIEVNN